jgi:hypothetical protein
LLAPLSAVLLCGTTAIKGLISREEREGAAKHTLFSTQQQKSPHHLSSSPTQTLFSFLGCGCAHNKALQLHDHLDMFALCVNLCFSPLVFAGPALLWVTHQHRLALPSGAHHSTVESSALTLTTVAVRAHRALTCVQLRTRSSATHPPLLSY